MGDQKPDNQTDAVGQRSAGQRPDLLAQLVARHLPPEPTHDQLIATYDRVFSALWFNLAVLMGHGGAQIIFARAVQLAGRQTQIATQIRPTATALDFTALRATASLGGDAHLHAGMAALAAAVEQLIGTLLGPGLSRSVLRDVELALARQPQLDPREDTSARAHGEGGSQQ